MLRYPKGIEKIASAIIFNDDNTNKSSSPYHISKLFNLFYKNDELEDDIRKELWNKLIKEAHHLCFLMKHSSSSGDASTRYDSHSEREISKMLIQLVSEIVLGVGYEVVERGTLLLVRHVRLSFGSSSHLRTKDMIQTESGQLRLGILSSIYSHINEAFRKYGLEGQYNQNLIGVASGFIQRDLNHRHATLGWLSKRKWHVLIKNLIINEEEKRKLLPTGVNTNKIEIWIPLHKLLNKLYETQLQMENLRTFYVNTTTTTTTTNNNKSSTTTTNKKLVTPHEIILKNYVTSECLNHLISLTPNYNFFCPSHKDGKEIHPSLHLTKIWFCYNCNDPDSLNDDIGYVQDCIDRGLRIGPIRLSYDEESKMKDILDTGYYNNTTTTDELELNGWDILARDGRREPSKDEKKDAEEVSTAETKSSSSSTTTFSDKRIVEMFSNSRSFDSEKFLYNLPDTYVKVCVDGEQLDNVYYSLAARKFILLYKFQGRCRACTHYIKNCDRYVLFKLLKTYKERSNKTRGFYPQ